MVYIIAIVVCDLISTHIAILRLYALSSYDIFIPGESTAGNSEHTGAISVNLNLERDGDKVWVQMVDAGFTVTMPFAKQFWV